MHVLFIPSWYPANSADVNGIFFREQALALSRNGLRVGVIQPVQRSLLRWPSIFSGKYGLDEENDCGLPTLRWHSIRWCPLFARVNKAILIRQGLQLFNAYVARHGTPDILHAHSTIYGGIIARSLQKKAGIPYVITEHSTSYARNILGTEQRTMAMEAVMHASCRIAVSEPFGTLLQDYFGIKAGQWVTVPNIVSNHFADYPISRSRRTENSFIFLCVALLSPKKAIDNLLVAFALAFKDNVQIILRIGGDGSERQKLEKLVQSLGINRQVYFLGALTRKQVAREMAKTDVFVLPSHYETFGVVVIEALALGKPVVATRCGGPESILRSQDGELVPVNDPQALAVAMQKMCREINKYNSQEIRKTCLVRFGETSVVARLRAVYERVILFCKRA